MCMNCGCGTPDERHGHPENITVDDLRRAGEVNGQSLRESARNILASVDATELDGEAREGLAEPAGTQGAREGARGSPESES